jgi:Zn finger protein HypA/HybF involved in hydrogenase expression
VAEPGAWFVYTYSMKTNTVKVKVVCMECGRKFSTADFVPECPKCGGSDVDVRE